MRRASSAARSAAPAPPHQLLLTSPPPSVAVSTPSLTTLLPPLQPQYVGQQQQKQRPTPGIPGGGPVETCRVPLLAPSQRYVAVQLVTDQPLYFVVEAKSRVKDLCAQARRHLAAMGMVAAELLGLAILQDGECLFIDPESKLVKYAPKSWRSPNNYGLDSNGDPSLVLHLRVQFYVDSPLLLRDSVSRLHYYLQLRLNLLQGERACPHEERLLRMLGCALQADLGDLCRDRDDSELYFNPSEYLPAHAVERLGTERLVRGGVEAHAGLRGVSTAEAQLRFISEACAAGSALNLQLHRLQRVKREITPSAWLGVCARGIDIYEETNISEKTITASFQWANIPTLCFDRKKFEVRAVQEGQTVRRSFYTGSAERSQQLLRLCRASHEFSMALGPRLAQLRREHEEAERKRLRDCSLVPRRIATRCMSGCGDVTLSGSGCCKAMRSEQRESVISSASSNTTSGIVSDRVLSFDESEDDLEIEIMINSPPAPISSVESLALAHLQDQEEPTDQESLQGEISSSSSDQEDEVDGMQAPTPSSLLPCPRQPAADTPGGATEGSSQCSSSGSTVKHAKEASNSSSLELGFSHTAQNSTLSEPSITETLDYSVTSAQASAGAYPSRAPSVSLTLDSNSDYVQLPPLSTTSEENYVFLEPLLSEADARFITTRPSVNVLTAHTVSVPSVSTPTYTSTPPPPAPASMSPPPPPQLRLEPRVKVSHNVTPPPIVVTRNNYLDVRATGAMATVYTRQLSQSQIEQFKRQLCSDVDYVIFPVRDPAISRKEYADHKLLTRLLPPPYCSAKGSLLYRSAPNVQALCPAAATTSSPSLACQQPSVPQRPVHHQFPGMHSVSNLAGMQGMHSTSNLPASLRCSISTHNLARSYDTAPAPPARAASDDNLLAPPPRPPPRPPPLSSRAAPSRPPRFPKQLPTSLLSTCSNRPSQSPTPSSADSGVLDIRTLREKSRHLDLPLISALCNDRSLLRQTRGEVNSSGGGVSRRRSSSAATSNNRKLYPRQPGSALKARQTAHRHPTTIPSSNPQNVNKNSSIVNKLNVRSKESSNSLAAS